MTVTIGLLIWLAVTVLIIWVHFWLCRKIVFIELQEPTRSDLMDCQYDHGGPLMMLPVVNIIFLIFTFAHWLELSGKINTTSWENKPLKR